MCFSVMIQAQAPLPEFLNEIQIPPIVNNLDDYHLIAVDTVHDFNPMGTDTSLNGITTFAFRDANQTDTTKLNTILGPTLIWRYKNQLTPAVTNMLPFDETTCHWHRAHVPQYVDGGPYQRINPGNTWRPEFRVLDKSATMWYHPHAMDLIYKHVQMGMSGMIIVEDPEDDLEDDLLAAIHDTLPTIYGVNDFPLIFQTKFFITLDDKKQIQSDFPPGDKI
jgi:FtsP/CotA-like multicopper oxidase with cupredoxin domain